MENSPSERMEFIKRISDFFISFFLILVLIPTYLLISILVLITAGIPIFYSQDRVGKHGKTFRIYKFRTMIKGAEEDGPQLSHEDDERIIGIGKFLRKWRLDELPQFFNVLIGDMSIIGPRPERQFYVNQLKEEVNNYESIFMVRPGITSSGMVNYGYASNIEEMKLRAPFDIQYVKEFSLLNDLKIVWQTILVLLDGRGK